VRSSYREFLPQRVFPGPDREDWRCCLAKNTDQLSDEGISIHENLLDPEWVRLGAGEHALDRVSRAVLAINWFYCQGQWLSLCNNERCAVAVTLRSPVSCLHPTELVYLEEIVINQRTE